MALAQESTFRSSVSMFIFIACGTWLIALGLYFMLVRSPLLPEDVRYIGTSGAEIQAAVPGLARWLHRVFTVMGGFIVGVGVLTIFAAVSARVTRKRWTVSVLALTGLFTVGTMTATNFQLNSDFKWLLLVPTALWLVGLAFNITSRSDG